MSTSLQADPGRRLRSARGSPFRPSQTVTISNGWARHTRGSRQPGVVGAAPTAWRSTRLWGSSGRASARQPASRSAGATDRRGDRHHHDLPGADQHRDLRSEMPRTGVRRISDGNVRKISTAQHAFAKLRNTLVDLGQPRPDHPYGLDPQGRATPPARPGRHRRRPLGDLPPRTPRGHEEPVVSPPRLAASEASPDRRCVRTARSRAPGAFRAFVPPYGAGTCPGLRPGCEAGVRHSAHTPFGPTSPQSAQRRSSARLTSPRKWPLPRMTTRMLAERSR